MVTLHIVQKNFFRALGIVLCKPQKIYYYVSIPYYKNLREKISNLFKSNDISTAFIPQNVMEHMLYKFKPIIPPSPYKNMSIAYSIPVKIVTLFISVKLVEHAIFTLLSINTLTNLETYVITEFSP